MVLKPRSEASASGIIKVFDKEVYGFTSMKWGIIVLNIFRTI
jgi:hypothetical protein